MDYLDFLNYDMFFSLERFTHISRNLFFDAIEFIKKDTRHPYDSYKFYQDEDCIVLTSNKRYRKNGEIKETKEKIIKVFK